jgi:phosphoribosylanthranilate isomerase
LAKVKICGITNPEDALCAAEYGADALGFVFYEKSPRFIGRKKVKEIVKKLPPFILKVGLFVNASVDDILETVDACHLDLVQLHGDEDVSYCKEILKKREIIKAIRVKDEKSIEELQRFSSVVHAFLLDAYVEGTYGGTGRNFNWDLVKKVAKSDYIIVAGGLNCDNISSVIKNIKPYGVDVSSGVEKRPGIKDKRMLAEFISKAKKTY